MTQLIMHLLGFQPVTISLTCHTRLLQDGLCLRLQCPSPLHRLPSFHAQPANNKATLIVYNHSLQEPLATCSTLCFTGELAVNCWPATSLHPYACSASLRKYKLVRTLHVGPRQSTEHSKLVQEHALYIGTGTHPPLCLRLLLWLHPQVIRNGSGHTPRRQVLRASHTH